MSDADRQLAEIAEGDCATVWVLTDRRRPIAGKVQGIGAGGLMGSAGGDAGGYPPIAGAEPH